MVNLTLAQVAATASASPLALFAPVAAEKSIELLVWILSQPLAWAFITPWLTERVKGIPQLDEKNRTLVRSVAGILGVLTGFLASWATGDMTSINFEQSAKTLGESAVAVLAAFGLYDLNRERKAKKDVGPADVAAAPGMAFCALLDESEPTP